METPNINKILALPINKGCSVRGADMGRIKRVADQPHKLYLQRVTFVSGDYDRGGAYWGGVTFDSSGKYLTPPLWCAFGDYTRVFVRGIDREQAKQNALQLLPGDGWTFHK